MAYSTSSDIEKQLDGTTLVELTDDSGDGSLDDAVISQAISDADEEIDGHLGGRMTVPLSPVPGILKKYSVDIAIYNLFARRHDSIPEIRKERYENAVKFLGKVAEGKISLGQSDPTEPAVSDPIAFNAEDSVMTTDTLDRF
jgi:phage gp36-like protein